MKNKRGRSKQKKPGNFKRVFIDKVELMAIIFFILALFLLDVNVNMLAVYGPEITVPVMNDIRVTAASMFWLGFIIATFSFFIFSIRSMYKRKRLVKLDIFFVVLGAIGLSIILSGGILLFGPNDNLQIPFFKWMLTRVTFYHIGIGLSLLTVIYFALTK